MAQSPAIVLAIVTGVIVAQRAVELWLARRHELWARARGAVEHGARHYPWIVTLHACWLLGWIAEAWARGPVLSPWWPALVAVFAAAQGLRYWAIVSLGRRWNTRILVLPAEPLETSGPYRFIRHPNYVAVVVELAAVPLLFDAWITALVASALNAALLLFVRIPAETRALGLRR